MELDELKQSWNKNPEKNNINTDIMEIIQHKSHGPIEALKRVFRKQIIMMASLPFLLLATNLNDLHSALTSIMFWSYVVFCIGIIVFAWYNYRITGKMEEMGANVRMNLEQQLDLLQKRMKWELIAMRGVLLFFIILTELVPYVQHYRMLDLWHSFSRFVRFGAYAILLVLQYFLNRRISERKVGRHIMFLKELINDMR